MNHDQVQTIWFPLIFSPIPSGLDCWLSVIDGRQFRCNWCWQFTTFVWPVAQLISIYGWTKRLFGQKKLLRFLTAWYAGLRALIWSGVTTFTYLRFGICSKDFEVTFDFEIRWNKSGLLEQTHLSGDKGWKNGEVSSADWTEQLQCAWGCIDNSKR